MFENEGTEIESTQSDVTEPSSEAQVDAQPEQQAAAPTQKEVPFHEHPRWKEVMEERNAERQARAQLEQKLAQMERQFQQSQRPKDTAPSLKDMSPKMRERLQGIDPEYASYMSALEQEAVSTREEMRQFREQQFVERAVSRFEELNKTGNVPQELTPVLRAQLDQMYREGKIRSLQDLEAAHKSVYEPLSKLLSDRDRQSIAKYTTDKKTAAAKPATPPKGRAAAPGQAQAPTNPQDRRKALIAEAMTQIRASKDTG